MNQDTSSQRKIGTGMFILAWLVVLLLLGFYFDEELEQQFNPNQQPLSSNNANGRNEVILQPNRQHHYLINGLINDQEVVFLLDTGATDVAIPEKLARKLQLKRGQRQQVLTANGVATAYRTSLKQLQIGSIVLNDINASITPGMPGDIILLGMSALRELEFSQQGDTLILRQ
jgi:aspartyl protease family protein